MSHNARLADRVIFDLETRAAAAEAANFCGLIGTTEVVPFPINPAEALG